MTARAHDLEFRTRVDDSLAAFVDHKAAALSSLGPEIRRLITASGEFIAGGKRLRPQFAYAGWLVAGGHSDEPGIVEAAAALEWLQGSALVHDDLMDGSDTRRGRPSIHRAFEGIHRDEQRHGDPEAFGRSAAVLTGDLMLSWCDEMLTTAILTSPVLAPRIGPARGFFDLCKTEVVAGQFLDVVGQTRQTVSWSDAMTIVRYKSAKYTVERPLHLGAALAGADAAMIEALSAVALPLGEAFQLRDDVLGVFGDPAVTGKPAGDDLREGKRTVLIARAHELTDDAGRDLLNRCLGTTDGVAPVAQLIRDCGALEAVERDISDLEAAADLAIERLGPVAKDVLVPLALTTTRRTS